MSFKKKLWHYLPAEWSHKLSPFALKIYRRRGRLPGKPFSWRPFQWKGLSFPNPLGTAGGTDKNSRNIQDWTACGAGFCEVGAVTPDPQQANPGRTLLRDFEEKSLWNSLGFPNKGLNFTARRLRALPPPRERAAPVFVNIGKNRDMPVDDAVYDLKNCIYHLSGRADAFVINISSPNTEGLRELFSPERLPGLLAALRERADKDGGTPLILKLSPDLSDSDFLRVLEQSLQAGIDGFSVCNSTTRREGGGFPAHGGVSGRPLAERSLHLLKLTVGFVKAKGLKEPPLIVSCGGVLEPSDVFERLRLGADLVQVYSALVFSGPGFFKLTALAADRV